MRTSGRTVTLVLGTGPSDGASVAALRLAEEAMTRGHRVAVYTYADGALTGAVGATSAPHVAALVKRGVHGGLLSWVVDGDSVRERAATPQVAGVVTGDGGDLWRFVRDADVVLGVSR